MNWAAVSQGTAPLKHRVFRRLWAAMGVSYAGDRLQELAQAWLVATLTQSALAVGLIAFVAAVPQLLMPMGGVIADQVDRRRLVVIGQFVGAVATAAVGVLVVTGQIALWHIYAWAFLAGLIWLFCRPAFKVLLTESVPVEEVSPATALNSMTETSAMVVVNGLGSGLLSVIGLPSAFVLNGLTYLFAGLGLRGRERRTRRAAAPGMSLRRLAPDLRDGLRYLAGQPALLFPLLSTLALTIAALPAIGLLAAIVQANGGNLMQFGLLSAAGSLGGLAGAAYAGVHGSHADRRGRHATYALVTAGALFLFAVVPFGYATALPLAVIGFVLFAEAVWNTSRVKLRAEQRFQARLQALTTMTFTLGVMLGQLWAGFAVERTGTVAFLAGAGALAAATVVLSFLRRRRLR